METINLNLIPTGARPVLHASQYDKGRQFRANLFEGSAVYTLTGAETISIAVRKPDGHVITEGITNTSDSYVIIETTEQMTACAGESFAEVKIEEGGDLLGTLNLILAVEQSPEAGGDPSESFIYNLETQIADAVADQYDSNNVIFDPAPVVGHGTGYVVSSEGVKNYVDNAIGGLSIPEELNDLNDVDTTTPTQGEAFVWDGTKWVNGTPELDVGDLDDVTITTPANGDIFVYDNGTWVNVANPASTANFAPDYDDTATYNTNDKVIYNNLLYICLEDNITGAWDSTKWQQISTADYNASNLEYSSGVSVADKLTSLDTNKVGAWTYNGQYTINSVTGTVNWNLINAMPNNTKELLFAICIGNNHRVMRWSLTIPFDVFGDYGCFPDFSLGTDRIYCTLSKNTNSQIGISGVNIGTVSSDITLNCYYR